MGQDSKGRTEAKRGYPMQTKNLTTSAAQRK